MKKANLIIYYEYPYVFWDNVKYYDNDYIYVVMEYKIINYI